MRRGLVKGLVGALTGVTVAAGLPAALVGAAPAAEAEVCRHRTGVNHDGGIFPDPFTEDSVCGNRAGASVHASPSADSAQVGVLDSTSSWFLCWTRGQRHGGGNDVWYYTQGDRVVSNPERRAYGFVPAQYLNTTNDPDDARLSPCPAVPSGPTTGYMVYDRTTHATAQSNEHKQFRSASLVKVLIALDYLESRGPDAEIPAADARLLQPMLRSSDDNAARTLWQRGGRTAVIDRMVTKIGLTDTAPPGSPDMWGYTAISAADMVKVYRYTLESAHPKFRDFVMGNLHLATRCAADGWDQFFGIPRVVPQPWAIKQGWSGFGKVPADQQCRPQPAGAGHINERAAAVGVDITSVAMHTSGTYCASDRKIMVVLSLNPAGTSWKDSADRLTALTGELYGAASC